MSIWKKGDRGTMVLYIQRALLVNLVPRGPLDGVFGQETENGVRQFQRDQQLKEDGIVGPVTFERLKERVKWLQECLGIKQDGLYGPETEAKVREYQQKHGLDVDGLAGEETQFKNGMLGS